MLIQVRSFLVVATRSVDTTIVRTQNIQIYPSLRCKQIDMSTAGQFTVTFRSNAQCLNRHSEEVTRR